jgi:hypothetical protein
MAESPWQVFCNKVDTGQCNACATNIEGALGILHQALKVVNTFIPGSQAPAWELRVWWKLQLPVIATKLELRRVGSEAGAWEPAELESVNWNMKDAH